MVPTLFISFLAVLLLVAGTIAVLFWRSKSRESALRSIGVPNDLPLLELSRFLSIGAARIHYQEAGRGVPLVLLHGFGASTVCWSFVLPALAKRFRVIVPDLKGLGLSTAPRDGQYSLQHHTAVIASLLDRLGVRDAVVCGNSFGGSVALALALSRPDQVSRLVLIAAAVDAGNRERALRHFFRLPVAGEVAACALFSFPWFLRRQMLRIYHQHSHTVTPARVHLYFRALTTSGMQYAALSTLRRWSLNELDEQLPRIHQPALVLWGANDCVVPLEAGRLLAAKLPNSELTILPACGHSPEEELPGAAVECIERFISAGLTAAESPAEAAAGG